MIEKTNSVCVTIRRGDFVTDPGFKRIYMFVMKTIFIKQLSI